MNVLSKLAWKEDTRVHRQSWDIKILSLVAY